MTSATTTSARPGRLLSVPLMLVAGALVAIQSQINSRLAEGLGEGLRAVVLAATVNFGSGLVVLSAIALVLPVHRAGARGPVGAVKRGDLRWYDVAGGLCAAYIVATPALTVGALGISLFIVAFTAGQAVSALAADRLGLSPGGRHALTAGRLIAAGLAVLAVLVKTGTQTHGSAARDTVIVFAIIALSAGVVQSVQQTVNGRASIVAGTFVITWANFAVAFVALVVVLALSLTVVGDLSPFPTAPWLYAGGLCGMGFIAIAAWTVQMHGVLVLSLCMIGGQVITAEILEVLAGSGPVSFAGLAGGGLTLLGVVIALWLRPTRSG